MILTETEYNECRLYSDMYGAMYIAIIFDRLNITMNAEQQARWVLFEYCCNAWYQWEIDYIATSVFKTHPGGLDFPAPDGLFFMSMWILFGDPPADYELPWANEEIVTTLVDAIGCNQYDYAAARYWFRQFIEEAASYPIPN